MFRSIFQKLFRNPRHSVLSTNHKRRPLSERGYRPLLEFLEDRLAPATITVNNVTDAIFNPNPAALPATLGSIVSLRDAIKAANNDAPNVDTILLVPGTYTFNNVDNTTLGNNALPVITGSIIIEDAGSAPVILNVAGASMRVFDVAQSGHLTLQGITISGGVAQGAAGSNGTTGGGGAAGLGGALFNQGTVSIYGCTFTDNQATGGAGGNVTSGPGGAGGGPDGGASGVSGGFGSGGGGSLTVGGNGGFGAGSGGGSTSAGTPGFGAGSGGLAGGGAAALGGAIFNDQGILTIINSTITSNTVTAGAAGTGGGATAGSALGSGIFNYNGTLDSYNDTIAGNIIAGTPAPQSASDVYNLGNGASDTQQGTVSEGAITVPLTFPTPGPQPLVIINTGNLTGTPATQVLNTTTGALPLTDAVQTLSFGGDISGGYFTLTVGGAGGPTTAPIKWTDSPAGLAANIRAAIDNLAAAYSVSAGEGTTTDGFPGAVSATLVFSNPAAVEANTELVIYNQEVDGDGNLDNSLIGTYSTVANLGVPGLQTIAFNGNITGGTFALGLTFPLGNPVENTVVATAEIAWSGSPTTLASNIATAVNSLLGALDNGDTVTVGADTIDQITFPTPGPQNAISVNIGGLTGSGEAVAVFNNAAGALPDVDSIQTLEFTGNITGGTFTLTFSAVNGVAGTVTTPAIAWDANPSTLAANIRFAIDTVIDDLSPSTGAGALTDTISFPFATHFSLFAEAGGLTAGANGTPAVSVADTGTSATFTFAGDIVGGTFDLVDGAHTAPVAWSANPATLAANIQTALNSFAPTTTGTDMFNTIVGQYVDNAIAGGSNYSTGTNNLALADTAAGATTLTFTTTTFLGLGTLSSNGGFTQTMPLYDSSPAVNAGANLTALFATFGLAPTDQVGAARGTVWSIGAYQNSTPGLPAAITLVPGSATSGTVSKAYVKTLQVKVTDAFGTPLSGVTVTFNAPSTGATVTLATTIVTTSATGKTTTTVHRGVRNVIGVTNASGIVTATLTANTKTGTFIVDVTVNGITTPLAVTLTNLPAAPTGLVVNHH